jgi:hypothetical protein
MNELEYNSIHTQTSWYLNEDFNHQFQHFW